MPTGNSRPDETGPADQTSPTLRDASPIESYLRGLVDAVDDVPLMADLVEADLGTPRGTASIARAALAWYREGLEAAIRERLEQDLRENDFLVVWRLRRMSGDLSEADDWSAIASWTPIAELQRLRTYEPEVA
jgi:hypothetical protein